MARLGKLREKAETEAGKMAVFLIRQLDRARERAGMIMTAMISSKIFWTAAVVVAMGLSFLFLSATLKAGLGGDDVANFDDDYMAVFYMPFKERLSLDIAKQFNIDPYGKGRYFPFSGMTWVERGYFLQTIDLYRTYIILWTLADCVLIGILVAQITRRYSFGAMAAIVAPLMINLFDAADSNGMYTYMAIMQRTAFFGLLSLIFLSIWVRRKKSIWSFLWRFVFMLLSCVCFMRACLMYEAAYLFIFPAVLMPLALHAGMPKNWKRVPVHRWTRVLKSFFWRAGRYITDVVPIGSVCIVAYAIYKYAEKTSTEARSVDTTVVMDQAKIIQTTLFQAYGALPLSGLHVDLEAKNFRLPNVMNYENSMAPIFAGIIVFLGVFLYWRRERRTDRARDLLRSFICFLTGIILWIGVSGLIGLTERFQDPANSNWTMTWITAVLGSFGVAIALIGLVMFICTLISFLPPIITVPARFFAGIALGGVICLVSMYNGAKTREEYTRSGRYERDWTQAAVETGLFDEVPEDAAILSNNFVWPEQEEEHMANFFYRYSGIKRPAWFYYSYQPYDFDGEKYVCNFEIKNHVKYIVSGKVSFSGENINNIQDVKLLTLPEETIGMALTYHYYTFDLGAGHMTLRTAFYPVAELEFEEATDSSERMYHVLVPPNPYIDVDSIDFVRYIPAETDSVNTTPDGQMTAVQ